MRLFFLSMTFVSLMQFISIAAFAAEPVKESWKSISSHKEGPLIKGFQKGEHDFCFIYPKYIVRVRDFTDRIGEDTYLYLRGDKKADPQSCETDDTKLVFSVTEKGTSSFWFWGLHQDYLFIDNSSSNIGVFNVYDLNSKKQVLQKSYYDFIGPRLKGNSLSFGRSKGDDRSKCGRPLTEHEENSGLTFTEEEVALETYDLAHEMKLTTEGKHCELISTQ